MLGSELLHQAREAGLGGGVKWTGFFGAGWALVVVGLDEVGPEMVGIGKQVIHGYTRCAWPAQPSRFARLMIGV